MSVLLDVYACLRQILSLYEKSEGVSVDDYCDTPLVHPMAEGKYLSTLAELFNAELINLSVLQRKASKSLARLERLNLARDPQEACWGLGFSYRNCPSDEPFVITTAIVTHGLLDLPGDMGGALASRALRWLKNSAPRTFVELGERKISLPLFSPNMPDVVINVVAVSAAALHRANLLTDSHGVVDWLLAQYRYPVGWPYTEGSCRIDLLHQCYILNSLIYMRGVQKFEEQVFRMLGIFKTSTGFLDKIDFVPSLIEKPFITNPGVDSWFAVRDNYWVVRYKTPARDWSIGELLVLISRLCEQGCKRVFWEKMLRKTLELAKLRLEKQIDGPTKRAIRFRHSMHLVHGVASAIRYLRRRKTRGVGHD